jgi:hypothetical protein
VDKHDGEKKATVIIALMQKDSSAKKEMLYIHFKLYKVNCMFM